jgi:hypothetical protein
MNTMNTRQASFWSLLLLVVGACGGGDKGNLQPLIPAVMASSRGADQTALVGTVLPDSLRVLVSDAAGSPAAAVQVTWSVVDGGGAISPATSATGSNGIAAAQFTLGPNAGQQHAQAAVSGLAGSPVVFTATATTTPPSGVTLTVLSGGDNVPDRYSSDLWVHGSYAYTGTWGGFARNAEPGDVLNVWSLSASGAPTLVDSIKTADISTVSDVQVSEDGQVLMFTAEYDPGGGLYLYSLADPAHPVFLSYAAAEGGLHTGTLAEINGRRYAFGARNPYILDPAMLIYDVTDPINVAVVATVPVPANYGIHDTYVRDGLAFAFAWNTGVIIYDVGNGISAGSPSHPVEVGRLLTAANGVSGGSAVHNGWWFHNPVTGENRYLFIGQEGIGEIGSRSSGDIHVVDVSDLHRPHEVAFFHLNGAGTHNFWMDEPRQILYAAYYNAGVVAVDVSGTLSGNLSGRLLSQIKPGGSGNTYTWGVQLANGSLYAIDMLSGLWQLGVQ